MLLLMRYLTSGRLKEEQSLQLVKTSVVINLGVLTEQWRGSIWFQEEGL